MFLAIDGLQVFSLSFGSGRRTFLAQGGWIGSSEVWLPTFERLDPSWRTVTFDHRGAGETVVPVEAITYDTLVDDVFRVMDALAIDRCVIGGESAGTQIVLEAALRDPTRFDGVVLVDGAAGLPRPPGTGTSPIAAPVSEWPGTDHAERMRWFVGLCFPEDDAESDGIRRWAHDILMRAEPAAAERLWGIGRSAAATLAERIESVPLPVLLIRGERDALVPRESMQQLKGRLPLCRHVEIQGAGHVPIMTRPDEVAGAIDAYFIGRSVTAK